MSELDRAKPDVDAIHWADIAGMVQCTIENKIGGDFTVGYYLITDNSPPDLAQIIYIYDPTGDKNPLLINVLGGVFSTAEHLYETTDGSPLNKTGVEADILTVETAGIVEPEDGKKSLGWLYQDPVPHDELNWRWKRQWETLDWLQGNAIRRFQSLTEAIGSTDEGRQFTIGQNGSCDPAQYVDLFNSIGIGGVNNVVYSLATDGERLYYIQDKTGGGYEMHAVSPEDNTLTDPLGLGRFWTVDLAAYPGAPKVIEADGRYVYVLFDAATDKLYRFDKTDGSYDDDINAPWSGYKKLRANGQKIALPDGVNVAVYQNEFLGPGGPMGGPETAVHGATVRCVAVDHAHVYFGGAASGGIHVRAAQFLNNGSLGAMSLRWAWAATATPFTAYDLACDGEHVYVAGDYTTVGGNYNVWCISRDVDGTATSPVIKWQADIQALGQSGNNADGIAVDDRYVYVSTGGEIVICDKESGIVLWHVGIGNPAVAGGVLGTLAVGVIRAYNELVVDGRRVYWANEAEGAGDWISSAYRGASAARKFTRVSGACQFRRPNYLAAITSQEF